MSDLKVVLVGINSKYIHSNLAIRYLKAYTEDLDYQCELREFSINDRKERIFEELLKEKADIIAFSCYIWNIEMVKALSKLIKLVSPDIEIIFGGPEVSYDGFSFLNENKGAIIIVGEGEETYKKLLELKIANIKSEKRNNRLYGLEKIRGIYYRDDNEIKFTGQRDIIDINKVKFPYIGDNSIDNKIVYYEASRGCPFGCKYCLSSTDSKVRFRDFDLVKEELNYFIEKKVKLVKFVDRTFNCNVKFAMKIWEFLIEANTNTLFHFEISADLLTDEEIELLSNAPSGRFQFEVGIQTTNFNILDNINRKVNTKHISEKVKEVKILKNIKQHLDLIAGLPGEDFESCKRSFNDIYSMEPEEIQLGFLKILNGTPMKKEAEKWGMVYSPYPPYEILKTKDIGYWELIKLKRVEHVVDKYYNSKKFSNILKYFLMKFPTPFDFYYELGEFFEIKGYLNRNISNSDYYKIFMDFNDEVLGKSEEILKEIIKYDYLMFNKKRWLPEFLERLFNSEESKEIKRIILEKYPELNKNKIHIEKYSIDIYEFIRNNRIVKESSCFLYDNEGFHSPREITEYVQNKF
ncbi:B12-binding domain-containing radical SAM protein [Clostridium sediminicola]|uniref:B12-binding domain-containing radical SAM protein n=1 Tax=Clostridium sediminicola TaxID=3114879 RepID=UPI0031F24196